MNTTKSTNFSGNWEVIHTLVRKDCRLFVVPTVGLFLLTMLCYMLAMLASDHRDNGAMNNLSELIFSASMGGLVLVPLLAAVFGGVAIAGERSDRTADFLALLPVSRRQIVMSKWIASISILSVFVVCNLFAAVCATLFEWIPETQHIFDGIRAEDFDPVAVWIGMAISLYGVAWLVSTLTQSAPISACVAIGVTVILPFVVVLAVEMGLVGVGVTKPHRVPQVFVLGILTHLHGIRGNAQFESLATASCAMVIGLASLVSGTVYYLKRIAP